MSCRCVQNNICDTNPCKTSTLPLCKSVDGVNYSCECTATSCGAGKSCEGGVCENCVKGVKCNCPGSQVSDGNGGCYTPNDACNPNPCPAEAPSCSALDETSYSCSCTSGSCPDGKRCSDMACQNCTAGDDCGCSSSGKEADGNGGCKCPGIKVSNGYGGCRCPDGYISDGRGGCEIEDPCANKSCAKAKKCDPDTGDCINCPLGEDCGCFDDDAFANGQGVCQPNNPCKDITCPSGRYCNKGSCVNYSCGNGGYLNAKEIGITRPVCSTLSEWQIITTGTSGGETCYACVCKGATFGGGGCCSGGKVTCGGEEGPCRECCNNSTNSCGSGKKCSDYKCINCPEGETCFCPDGKVADGKGGCKGSCSTNADCSGSRVCKNGLCVLELTPIDGCPSGTQLCGMDYCCPTDKSCSYYLQNMSSGTGYMCLMKNVDAVVQN